METINEVSLLQKFRTKCRQILFRQPNQYLLNFIQQSSLLFDASVFCLEDTPFAQIMLTLHFESIYIFRSQQQTHLHQSNEAKNYPYKSYEFHESKQFRKFLHLLSLNIAEEKLNSLRKLNFFNIPIQLKCIQTVTQGIQKSKRIRQLTFKKCQLTDSHVQIIKTAVAANVSIISLDLSLNGLVQSGGMIGKIISESSHRKNQILNWYLSKNITPQFDLAATGISQINLEGNLLNDKSAQDLIVFLQDDRWVQCINLSNNKIGQQGINKFVSLINQNSTLINLDLRFNQGFTKEYSKAIFKKLKQNIENYKKIPRKYNNTKSLKKKHSVQFFLEAHPISSFKIQEKKELLKENFDQLSQNYSSFRHFNKQPLRNGLSQNLSKQKTKKKLSINNQNTISKLYHSQRKSIDGQKQNDQNDLITQIHRQVKIQLLNTKNMNKTTQDNIEKDEVEKGQLRGQNCNFDQQQNDQCKKCHQMQLRALRAEKNSLQLEIQLRKLKHFLTKNLDVSAIGSSSNKLYFQNPPQSIAQNINFSASFNKLINAQNEDEMISKMQILMSQLTKIMQTVQLYQNTLNTIQNGFQNVNSLSKTVSLYDKPKQLLQVQQEISQDQELHLQQFRENSVSIIEKTSQTQENFLRFNRNSSGT